MISGLVPQSRVTTDCDVMLYLPAKAMAEVEHKAKQVAEEMGLASNWLNSDVQIRLDALPDGWEQRKVMGGLYDRLRVSVVSRPDLIAMKVLAGRDQDIEDLQAMRIRSDDVAFVESYLATLASKGTHQDQIDDARDLLASLEVYDHE